jgi:hypothetical protein
MNYYQKEILDSDFKELLGRVKSELGFNSLANSLKKVLSEEERKILIDYLNKNGK